MDGIIRWEPFQELMTLRQAMDKLFEEGAGRLARLAPGGEVTLTPLVDIYETSDKVGIKAAMPGVKPEDIDINITPDAVVIKGETKSEREIKEENYVRKESQYGTFARTISLPPGLKIDKAEATIENGMLTLEIPKAEEVKPRSVKIKAKAEPKKLEAKESKESKS